jgi:tetratricopeptide (TPR) repeat protein
MNYEEFHERFTDAVEAQDFSYIADDLQAFLTNSKLVIQNFQAVDYLIWLAEVLIKYRQLTEAEMVLVVACNAVDREDTVEPVTGKSVRQLAIYNLRGQVHYQLGKYGEAKKWCEKLKKLTQKCYGKKSRETMDVLTKLALTHEAVNDLSEAARHYDDALALARELLPSGDPFRMWMLGKLKQLIDLGELCTICYRRLPAVSLSCAFCTHKGIPAMNAILFQERE